MKSVQKIIEKCRGSELRKKTCFHQDFRLSQKDAESLWIFLETYELPFDASYLQFKLAWSERFGRTAIEEYKKFVFLAKASSVEITPSNAVDEVWHFHILHTQEYARFGREIGGFLHHHPGVAQQKSFYEKQYNKTLAYYALVFEEEAPRGIWM